MSDKVKMQFKKDASIRVTGTVDFVMQMEMLLKLRQISHYADAVHQRKSHFAMVVTAMLDLLASNYLAA